MTSKRSTQTRMMPQIFSQTPEPTFISMCVREVSRTSGMIRNGRVISLVVRYLSIITNCNVTRWSTVALPHQLIFTIRRNKTDAPLRLELAQLHTLVECAVINSNTCSGSVPLPARQIFISRFHKAGTITSLLTAVPSSQLLEWRAWLACPPPTCHSFQTCTQASRSSSSSS